MEIRGLPNLEQVLEMDIGSLPQIGWVDYTCRAEFIRPIIIGSKKVTLSYDALPDISVITRIGKVSG